jgi:hypothetical protein
MPGFMPGIHVLLIEIKTWMAGTSPAMTLNYVICPHTHKLRAINNFMISLVPA